MGSRTIGGVLVEKCFQSIEFLFDIFPLVEPDPTGEALRLTWWAVGELGVGMEAWTGWIGPGPLAVLPSGDDPPGFGRVAGKAEWSDRSMP